MVISIQPISAKREITSQLTHRIQKTPLHMTLEIQVLAWDGLKMWRG